MKKIITFFSLVLLLLSSFSYAKSLKKSTTDLPCGTLSSFSGKARYKDLVVKLEKRWLETKNTKVIAAGVISQVCEIDGSVIVNVPLEVAEGKYYFTTKIENQKLSNGYTIAREVFVKTNHTNPHAMFKYTIASKTLEKAKKNFSVIERGPLWEITDKDLFGKTVYYHLRKTIEWRKRYTEPSLGHIIFNYTSYNNGVLVATSNMNDANGCFNEYSYAYTISTNTLDIISQCRQCIWQKYPVCTWPFSNK